VVQARETGGRGRGQFLLGIVDAVTTSTLVNTFQMTEGKENKLTIYSAPWGHVPSMYLHSFSGSVLDEWGKTAGKECTLVIQTHLLWLRPSAPLALTLPPHNSEQRAKGQ